MSTALLEPDAETNLKTHQKTHGIEAVATAFHTQHQ